MRAQSLRAVLLVALLAGGVAVFLVAARRAPPADTSRVTWVPDAPQFGPVGYRDPAGAISPDGRWLAYSEGRFLRVRPIDGGPVVELPPNDAQIRTIAWNPDNRSVLADGYQTPAGWAVYDRVDRTRRGLWAERDPLHATIDGRTQTATARVADLRQPAWS